MTIYVDRMFDGQGKGWRKGLWCHMWPDVSDSELESFALSIGLEPRYFQTKNPRFHHFDLRASKRELALKQGAVEMPLTQWIAQIKEDYMADVFDLKKATDEGLDRYIRMMDKSHILMKKQLLAHTDKIKAARAEKDQRIIKDIPLKKGDKLWVDAEMAQKYATHRGYPTPDPFVAIIDDIARYGGEDIRVWCGNGGVSIEDAIKMHTVYLQMDKDSK